jgi:hypothetical protein
LISFEGILDTGYAFFYGFVNPDSSGLRSATSFPGFRRGRLAVAYRKYYSFLRIYAH